MLCGALGYLQSLIQKNIDMHCVVILQRNLAFIRSSAR